MITLNLTEDDLKVIGAGLNNMPYGVVAALVAKIGMQVVEQQENKEGKNPD